MAIDILVVEDEYTERQELTQLLETVTPPEHIRSAATCSAAIAAPWGLSSRSTASRCSSGCSLI